MIIIPFRPQHLAQLDIQDAQQEFRAQFGDIEYGASLDQPGRAFTGIIGGRVVGCAGVYELWAGRCVAWALLAADCGTHFKVIHRAVHGFLKAFPCRRVEAMVKDGFPAGHRWIKLLGFRCETPDGMPGYAPDGTKYFMYSRVK